MITWSWYSRDHVWNHMTCIRVSEWKPERNNKIFDKYLLNIYKCMFDYESCLWFIMKYFSYSYSGKYTGRIIFQRSIIYKEVAIFWIVHFCTISLYDHTVFDHNLRSRAHETSRDTFIQIVIFESLASNWAVLGKTLTCSDDYPGK